MSALFVVPKTYNSVAINSASAIDCMQFSIPVPETMSGFRPVAGGELFDFNYGTGAVLRPSPFQIAMVVTGVSAAAFAITFSNFFGLPPTGFYGEVHTFVVDVHGAGTTLSCEAELTSLQYTQDVTWYSATKKMVAGLIVKFTPADLFS